MKQSSVFSFQFSVVATALCRRALPGALGLLFVGAPFLVRPASAVSLLTVTLDGGISNRTSSNAFLSGYVTATNDLGGVLTNIFYDGPTNAGTCTICYDRATTNIAHQGTGLVQTQLTFASGINGAYIFSALDQSGQVFAAAAQTFSIPSGSISSNSVFPLGTIAIDTNTGARTLDMPAGSVINIDGTPLASSTDTNTLATTNFVAASLLAASNTLAAATALKLDITGTNTLASTNLVTASLLAASNSLIAAAQGMVDTGSVGYAVSSSVSTNAKNADNADAVGGVDLAGLVQTGELTSASNTLAAATALKLDSTGTNTLVSTNDSRAISLPAAAVAYADTAANANALGGKSTSAFVQTGRVELISAGWSNRQYFSLFSNAVLLASRGDTIRLGAGTFTVRIDQVITGLNIVGTPGQTYFDYYPTGAFSNTVSNLIITGTPTENMGWDTVYRNCTFGFGALSGVTVNDAAWSKEAQNDSMANTFLMEDCVFYFSWDGLDLIGTNVNSTLRRCRFVPMPPLTGNTINRAVRILGLGAGNTRGTTVNVENCVFDFSNVAGWAGGGTNLYAIWAGNKASGQVVNVTSSRIIPPKSGTLTNIVAFSNTGTFSTGLFTICNSSIGGLSWVGDITFSGLEISLTNATAPSTEITNWISALIPSGPSNVIVLIPGIEK